MRLSLLIPLLGLSAPLLAEPGLPDPIEVNQALDAHPSVVAWRSRVDATRADANARAKGPQEITVSGSYVRRNVDLEGSFNEFDAQAMRPIRLPGKAAVDRKIGKYGIEAAENLAEDAKHQAALLLSGYWMDWISAAGEAKVDRQAVANFEVALKAVKRRVELGDASVLEADQTEAALGTARLMAEQSAGRIALARARLTAQFPSLALPVEPPEVPQPTITPQELSALRDHVLVNSHEIAAAEAEAQRMASLAERARRERTADPSIGLRVFSERSGMERGAGLLFSMPLGGGHRRALSDQALAEASAAEAEAMLARFMVQETADADVAEAQYRIATWQRAREALNAQMAALTKMRRGLQLGEIDLADLLMSERMVHEAFRSEIIARTDAMRAVTKLRIDSHELWIGD